MLFYYLPDIYSCIVRLLKKKDSLSGTMQNVINDYYSEIAGDINPKCPLQIDEITVLDSVAFYGGVYRYYYTITDRSLFDVDMWKTVGISNVRKWIREDPDMKDFLKYDINIEYNYSDTRGNSLFTFEIIPDDYRK